MKTIRLNFILSVLLVFFSLNGYSQNKNILSDSDEFDYLIGMEYEYISEFKVLIYKSKSLVTGGEIESSSTTFIKGDYQIITSESVRFDSESNSSYYKILDIIVLNGFYHSCNRCLLTSRNNNSIRSFHPIGNVNKDSILIAFERNNITGKYKQVNPKMFDWNHKSDLLRKY